jgi:hypothetical protein
MQILLTLPPRSLNNAVQHLNALPYLAILQPMLGPQILNVIRALRLDHAESQDSPKKGWLQRVTNARQLIWFLSQSANASIAPTPKACKRECHSSILRGTLCQAWPQRHRLEVHPHVCGDDYACELTSLSSSVHPHACGDDEVPVVRETGLLRFTPTRVGTMKPALATMSTCTVHPHACGDDGRVAVDQDVFDRFTPTRVGTILPE